MNHREEVVKKLREESEMIRIPDSLHPEYMMKTIKSQEVHRIKEMQKRRQYIKHRI